MNVQIYELPNYRNNLKILEFENLKIVLEQFGIIRNNLEIYIPIFSMKKK